MLMMDICPIYVRQIYLQGVCIIIIWLRDKKQSKAALGIYFRYIGMQGQEFVSWAKFSCCQINWTILFGTCISACPLPMQNDSDGNYH